MILPHPDVHKAADGRILNDFVCWMHLGDSNATRYPTGRSFAAFGTLLH
jgi:hypothetical protein